MYQGFYGLTESPFTIAPNPAFLFLSDRHREALAHLTYGLGESGGFVLLTGEVGTGKTTIFRTLLRELPDGMDLAFILNPALTPIELLATVCDQFQLTCPAEPTLKQLTDCLAEFLLANHGRQRQSVLVIDEAQHLAPEVLEQLRLLTNLETDTRKLLQVILIGQPELQQLLRRPELRQLAQRITARYHLLPLTQDELIRYVRHRLQVAKCQTPLFNASALRQLHRLSGGIPRLINLICERALINGYGLQRGQLTAKDIQQAASMVLGVTVMPPKPWLTPMVLLFCATLGVGAGWGLMGALSGAGVVPMPARAAAPVLEPSTLDAPPPPSLVAAAVPAPLPESLETVDSAMAAPIALTDFPHSELVALQGLFHHWQQPLPASEPCAFAAQVGLMCLHERGSWQQLLRLNRPAVVALDDGAQTPLFATLLARHGERWLLQLGAQQVWVQHSWFVAHYAGRFTLLWPVQGQQPHSINRNAPLAQVQWLEDQLAQVAVRPARTVSEFDEELTQAVKAFQFQHGLTVDGLAGRQTLTRIALLLTPMGPTLIQEAS